MKNTIPFLAVVCLALLAGCVADNRIPSAERERKIVGLAELAGTYRNVGWCPALECDAAPLTDVLFPRKRFAQVPDKICVTLPGRKTVRCEALADGAVVAVREFVEGRDFRIEDGRIPISVGPAAGAASDSASVGVGFKSKVLFLSSTGDVVLSTHSGGVGVFLMFLPYAGTGYDDSVYKRIEKKG
jgi:hypothetical protein